MFELQGVPKFLKFKGLVAEQHPTSKVLPIKYMQQDPADKAQWVSCINNLLVHNENGKLQDACIHVHICIYKLAMIQSFKWVKCVYINSVQAF